MTTTTFVSITCPACHRTSTIPVDALLVSIAVNPDAAHNPAAPGAAANGVRASEDATAGTVAWTCAGCDDLVRADLDWTALLTLVTAGVTLLDDGTYEPLPPHPEQPNGGAPLTHDDLLALHELLASDTWFDQVTTAGCIQP